MAENKNVTIGLDEKVSVINLAPWDVGFPNISTLGDTLIPANGTARMRREEIIGQVNMGNKLFLGTDDKGSHATLYVDDDVTRVHLEFDTEDGKRAQNIITKEKVTKWFELKTMSVFEKNIRENVITRAEKQCLLRYIKELRLDSYEKIEFCKAHCKYKIRGF